MWRLGISFALLLRAGAALEAVESLGRIGSALRDCPIVYFVHIPKTAGTALISVLKASKDWLQLKHAGIYVGHGKDFGELQWHQIAARRPRRAIVAEEIGLGALANRSYPFFDETCFVSTLREPAAWLRSAMAHMRVGFDAVAARKLYFDVDDVQVSMVRPPPRGSPPPRATVLAALERPGAVDALLGMVLGGSGDATAALPVANRCEDRRYGRPCSAPTDGETAQLARVVDARYRRDRRLHARVNATRHGLLLASPDVWADVLPPPPPP